MLSQRGYVGSLTGGLSLTRWHRRTSRKLDRSSSHLPGTRTGVGDIVDDTPPEYTSTSGCPIEKDTCPEEIQNFMDYYPDGSWMMRFTVGQIKRTLLCCFWFSRPAVGRWCQITHLNPVVGDLLMQYIYRSKCGYVDRDKTAKDYSCGSCSSVRCRGLVPGSRGQSLW
ncbi:uncharacterized protein EI90DRAFT_78879 [Cantharellus anzutake]|uniref:uncharacterized protein n=1 Tax=Cantharellus anzutake TaxID=1750568 RepID=UPI001907D72D|nr:uncharacterized protein EI90DRAFT_78879 [Cantharellus anzutake]KAF8336857.1 hypothetical protein EI90DRAFT_78879 [Cantharellus anzutake]